MDLIVDGYNLIGAEQGLTGSLEAKRNRLIQRLSNYQKIKQFQITLIFDGWQAGSREETVQARDGISVIYSRLGEKADAVIVRFARMKGSGAVVITSDREIRSAVERFGAVAISAEEFSDILRSVEEGGGVEDDDQSFEQEERGRSRHGSKIERRRNEKLKKLRL